MNKTERTSVPEPIFPEAVSGRTGEAGQSADEEKGRFFPCEGCGADLKFHIGQQKLVCPYCHFEKQLEWSEDSEIEEQDFEAMLARLAEWRQAPDENQPTSPEEGTREIPCQSCGATVIFTGPLTSSACPYCDSPLQLDASRQSQKRIPAGGVLPFFVTRKKANNNLKVWVSSRWFAPNDFYKKGVRGDFEGVYLPYWTFDAMTFTRYQGKRGEHYNVTIGSGKNRQTTQHTKWYPTSGAFQRFFDNVLVLAAKGMNLKLIRNLEPWPLSKCVPFNQELLAGLYARTYEVELDAGFVEARRLIEISLTHDIKSRIGGDEQRITSMTTTHDAVTFKHILLPVWLMSYRYKKKLYQVMVNAATGEVEGERPWSWFKMAIPVLVILGIVGAIALVQAFYH